MDNLPRNDKTITKLFLAAVNMIGFYPYFLRTWISLSHRKHWNILNIYFLLKFLIYRDIHNLDITNENKEVLKTRIKDCAFSSFCWFNDNGAPLNLSPEELAPLNHFQKTNNLIVQKSHEGNSITIIDKKFYLQKMQNISSDWSKFTQIFVAKNKKLNSIVNVEKHTRDLLKDFKKFEVIFKTVYNILKPRCSRLGILNGLCKIHKMLVDNCPTFWPFMPGIKALHIMTPNF